MIFMLYDGRILNSYVGAVIQSTLNEEQSMAHASALSDLTARASSMIGMLNQNESDDGDDELTFLRMRSKHREVMVSGDDHQVIPSRP